MLLSRVILNSQEQKKRSYEAPYKPNESLDRFSYYFPANIYELSLVVNNRNDILGSIKLEEELILRLSLKDEISSIGICGNSSANF
jgi:hypothetical protein